MQVFWNWQKEIVKDYTDIKKFKKPFCYYMEEKQLLY